MKKYLLGIIAVVLAIGFSSYTNSRNKQKKNVIEDLLYWYEVNPSTSRTIGAYQAYEFKQDMLTEACPDDEDQPICLFGSTDSSVTNNTFVGTAAEENLILEKE